MRVVTIVSLGACAVFGLAALVVAKTMLPNAASAKATEEVAGMPVVVAKAPLKFGDKLDASKIGIIKLPSNAVPEGAFSTVAQVLAQDGGGPPVALTPVAAREALLPSMLSGPGARASIAAEIADGFRAYTIKVSDVTGVGGHALPGDRVDVMLMRDLTPQAPTRSYVSEVVIQDVRVLGVDLNADPTSNKPATPSTATLEVSVPDAQKLAVASDLGKLSLALRKTGSTEVAMTSPMHASNFVNGGAAPVRAVRAYAPRRAPSAAPRSALIEIVASESKSGHTPRTRRAPEPAPAPAAPAAPITSTTASSSRPS